MKISMQTACSEIIQLRAHIERLTAEYERKNGAVKTIDIIKRGTTPANWNNTLVTEKKAQHINANTTINQQVLLRYANEPCLTAFAAELGVSVGSITKRAGRLGVSRNKTTKSENNPTVVRANARLEKTAEMLESEKSIDAIAEKLDISPRLVRHYRQQIESMQRAA